MVYENMKNRGIQVILNTEVKPYAVDDDGRGYFPLEVHYSGTDKVLEARAPEITDMGHILGNNDSDTLDDGSKYKDINKLYAEGTRIYWATGYRPNTSHIAAGSHASCLDQLKFVKTKPNLLIEGSNNIFAMGDCISSERFLNGERTSQFSEYHASTVFRNLQLLIDGALTSDLIEFKIPSETLIENFALIELGNVDLLWIIPDAFSYFLDFLGPEGKAEAEKKLIRGYDGSVRIGILPNGPFKEGFMQNITKGYGTRETYDMMSGIINNMGMWIEPATSTNSTT